MGTRAVEDPAFVEAAARICDVVVAVDARDGKVATVSIRERGRKTGIRLINYDSLMAFIAKQGDSGEQSKKEGGAQ